MNPPPTPRWSGRRRFLAAFALLLLALVGWMAWPQTEPQFQGMPASDYAKSILSTNFFNVALATNHLAPMGREVAVSAITTVLAREDSPWKHRYKRIFPHVPMWLRNRLAPPRFDQNLIIACATALGFFGPEAKPAVQTLTVSLDQGSDFVKWQTAEALSRIGPDARAAIPSLIATALSRETNSVLIRAKAAAIRALANVDPAGERSAPRLMALFDDPDATVVAAVIGSFASMSRRSPSLVMQARAALEPFLKRLQSDDATDRAFGATVLMYAQSFEADVMPVLLRAAPDTNSIVREAAVNSLTLFAYDPMVSHPHRVAAAKAVLQFGSPEQTWRMLSWLPQFLPEEGETVPLLIVALGNPSERTRGRAALTLGQLGVLARGAVPALIELRTDKWRNVREAATNALKSIDPSVP